MKKLVVVMIMGLCGTAVFAQSSTETDIIQLKKAKAKDAKLAPDVEAKKAPEDGLNIIEKKKLKKVQKTTLPATEAIRAREEEK